MTKKEQAVEISQIRACTNILLNCSDNIKYLPYCIEPSEIESRRYHGRCKTRCCIVCEDDICMNTKTKFVPIRDEHNQPTEELREVTYDSYCTTAHINHQILMKHQGEQWDRAAATQATQTKEKEEELI